jgi:hypothetical protein
MRLKGVVVVLILIVLSCSNYGKHGRIPENQLIKILADIHLADAISFSNKYKIEYLHNDSAYYFESLLSKYNVTRSQFDSTISWYSGNPDKYDLLYSKVLDRLNRMAAGINDKLHADSILTQSGNLWNRKRDWILPDDGPRENITFAVKVLKQGKYLLSARIKINHNDQSERPYMTAYSARQRMLKPDIIDTSTLVRLDKSGSFRLYSISVYLDKDTTTYIKGFILGSEEKVGNWIKSAEVRDIRLIYLSLKDFEAPE